jgi:uncharacterized repeat protein (TIGR03803 family)
VGGTSGFGTVFKLSTDGSTETILHSFLLDGTDGTYPYAALIQGADGTLYGLTYQGGTSTSVDGYGYGTLFKINADGSGYAILHNFDPEVGDDGKYPWPSLVIGNDGALYGTCSGGGSHESPSPNFGSGAVFRFSRHHHRIPVFHLCHLDHLWPIPLIRFSPCLSVAPPSQMEDGNQTWSPEPWRHCRHNRASQRTA